MSQTPFKAEKEIMLSILQAACDDIEAGIINPQAFQIKNNVLRDLKKHINIISTHLDIDIHNKHKVIIEPVKSAPVTSLFGKKLVFKDKPSNSIKTTEKIVEIETEKQSEELKNRFVVMSIEDILNTFDDVQIEGVANLMDVERDKDDSIYQFIDKIKAKIKVSIQKTPMEIAADELKAEAAVLYPLFVDMEVATILDSYSEPVIKFVAKMVNIPVGDNLPKKVNAQFITTIKEAITRKADLEAKGNV